MSRQKSHYHHIKKVLSQHKQRAQAEFHRRHKHVRRILKKHKIDIADLRQKGARVATTGAIAGAFLTTPLAVQQAKFAQAKELEKINKTVSDEEKRKFLEKVLSNYQPDKITDTTIASNDVDPEMIRLKAIFPSRIKEIANQFSRSVSPQFEEEVSQLVQAQYGIKAKVSLDSNRLNTYFGPLGAEQHLPRYPGDRTSDHSTDLSILSSGITPGRGAWGFWTNSKRSLTSEMVEQEKYYIAAQTFLAPGWRGNHQALYQWFKYRKVIIVNPRNEKAVVAVIGDAGPASWTGKNFGGSPEVMQTLESHDGRGRDSVFVLLVDDPENKIPLGPIDASTIKLAEV